MTSELRVSLKICSPAIRLSSVFKEDVDDNDGDCDDDPDDERQRCRMKE